MMKYTLRGLPASQARTDSLMADFSGLENLEKVVDSVLERLRDQAVGMRIGYRAGTFSKEDFDGYFSELIRTELGKVLAIQRAKAVEKARMAGAGSAASAVLRRMYKDGHKGNINIGGNRGRISSLKRMYEPGKIKPRHVSARTKQINEYYGPDRSFILRFLEFGTDVRTAKTFGPTGRRSTATWGARGSITPRSFFHQMSSDMEQAAHQLGQTLVGAVEEWIDKKLKEE